MDVEIHRFGADRVGRRVESVEHQVRRAGKQRRVLAAQRFSLGPVADDNRLAPGDRGHLAGGREAGATAAAQARLVECRDQGGPGGRQFTERRAVGGQRWVRRGQKARQLRWSAHESAYSVKPERRRNTTATATMVAHTPANAMNQTCPVSVPLPTA